MNEEPDRVYVEKSAIKDFERLREDSPFKGRENKELFLLAMSTGFHEGSLKKLEKKEGFVRTEYFSPEEKAVIKSIAIRKEGGLNVLLDKKKVYSIAEEYAAAGIKILSEKVFGGEYGSYIKKLESDLVQIYREKIKK